MNTPAVSPLSHTITIGRRIRARRRRLHLSQRELGRLIAVDQTTVYLLERGIGNMNDYLLDIAGALNVPVGWLTQ